MRRVNLAWNTEIPDQTIINAIQAMFTALRGKPVTLTVGKGLHINGLPEGNIYIDLSEAK